MKLVLCCSIFIISTLASSQDEKRNNTPIVIPLRTRHRLNNSKRWINSTLDKRSLTSLSLKNYYADYFEIEYYGSIEIGTPSKSYQVVFDTGLTDFWVSGFTMWETIEGREYYDPRLSSSAHALPQPFRIDDYAEVVVSGSLMSDNVTLGGYTVQKQIFGMANVIKGSENTSPAIGVMGLKYFESSEFGVETFLENLIKNGALSEKSFGFFFARKSDTELESQFTLNGYDKRMAGTPNFNPLISRKSWKIRIDSVEINGRYVIEPGSAQISTGVSGIYVSKSYAWVFYKGIRGSRRYDANTYSFPCTSTPSVVFKIGGINYPILKSDLILDQYRSVIPFTSKRCIGTVIGIDVIEHEAWILGYSFLKNVYTVFDIANRQIGFTSLTSSNSEKVN